MVGELMIERITEAPGLISADEFHFFWIFPAHLLQIFQYKPVVRGYRLPVFDRIPVKAVAAKCVVFFMDIHSYIKYTVHRGLPLYAVIPVALPSIVSIQANPRPYNGEVTSYYLFSQISISADHDAPAFSKAGTFFLLRYLKNGREMSVV